MNDDGFGARPRDDLFGATHACAARSFKRVHVIHGKVSVSSLVSSRLLGFGAYSTANGVSSRSGSLGASLSVNGIESIGRAEMPLQPYGEKRVAGEGVPIKFGPPRKLRAIFGNI